MTGGWVWFLKPRLGRIMVLTLGIMPLAFPGKGQHQAEAGETWEHISDRVSLYYLGEKKISGMSVAIVHKGELLFAKGYGKASVELDVSATPETVYPISSVSKMFAGLVAIRLATRGQIDLDQTIGEFLPNVPEDKRSITLRNLLQHTHGLEDFYGSDQFEKESGRPSDELSSEELIAWSLAKPLNSVPGEVWSYSLAGYVLLGVILEKAGGMSYPDLVRREVTQPLGIKAFFGDTGTLIPGRNPVMYESVDGRLATHIMKFPENVWPAGGLNLSVAEMAKLFMALDGEEFITDDSKNELWRNVTLLDGRESRYGLGWMSYTTAQGRQVVGHEGGGASWVIYYPEQRLAVIALSNMSGARADGLPYEIARAGFDSGLIATGEREEPVPK